MKEIWESVKGYEGLYEISDLGRVKRIYKNGKTRILKPSCNKQGYVQLALSKNNKLKTFKIHRLVAIAFIKNSSNKREVNHIDGNKKNNSLNNLEWVTSKENIEHAIKTGLRNKTNAKKINQYDLNNNFLATWSSLKEAQISCNVSHIVDCCKGKRKTAGGFRWGYVNDR